MLHPTSILVSSTPSKFFIGFLQKKLLRSSIGTLLTRFFQIDDSSGCFPTTGKQLQYNPADSKSISSHYNLFSILPMLTKEMKSFHPLNHQVRGELQIIQQHAIWFLTKAIHCGSRFLCGHVYIGDHWSHKTLLL